MKKLILVSVINPIITEKATVLSEQIKLFLKYIRELIKKQLKNMKSYLK